jgi:hypothetical protein
MESSAGGGGKLFWLGSQCRPLPLGCGGYGGPQVGPVFQDLTLRGRACPS